MKAKIVVFSLMVLVTGATAQIARAQDVEPGQAIREPGQLSLKEQQEAMVEFQRNDAPVRPFDASAVGGREPVPARVIPVQPGGDGAPSPGDLSGNGSPPLITTPVPKTKGRKQGGNCQGCPDVELPPNMANVEVELPSVPKQLDDSPIDCGDEANRDAPACVCERPANLKTGKAAAGVPCRPTVARPQVKFDKQR